MRVGILCLIQESNTFLNRNTKFHHFEEDFFLEGNEIREKMVDSHHEVGGFLEGRVAQVSMRCRYLQHAPCLMGPFASKHLIN